VFALSHPASIVAYFMFCFKFPVVAQQIMLMLSDISLIRAFNDYFDTLGGRRYYMTVHRFSGSG
jgi:hypothetical protein